MDEFEGFIRPWLLLAILLALTVYSFEWIKDEYTEIEFKPNKVVYESKYGTL